MRLYRCMSGLRWEDGRPSVPALQLEMLLAIYGGWPDWPNHVCTHNDWSSSYVGCNWQANERHSRTVIARSEPTECRNYFYANYCANLFSLSNFRINHRMYSAMKERLINKCLGYLCQAESHRNNTELSYLHTRRILRIWRLHACCIRRTVRRRRRTVQRRCAYASCMHAACSLHVDRKVCLYAYIKHIRILSTQHDIACAQTLDMNTRKK